MAIDVNKKLVNLGQLNTAISKTKNYIDDHSYSLPVAGENLGGIKKGGDISISADGVISVNDDSHNHTVANIDGLSTTLDNKMPKSGGSFTGKVTTSDLAISGIEEFNQFYVKRYFGKLSIGATHYDNLAAQYKDGTYHRLWRLRFKPTSDSAKVNFWGKIKITLMGTFSSFNASGVLSKMISCNFNHKSIYNNVGFYDGLGVTVEKDFRISEAIWNESAQAWEILIWQKNLSGNNEVQALMLESWSSALYTGEIYNITAQPVELTQDTTYTAPGASATGSTKTVAWEDEPVFETPLGLEIADKTWVTENYLDKNTEINIDKFGGYDFHKFVGSLRPSTSGLGMVVYQDPSGAEIGRYTADAARAGKLCNNSFTPYSVGSVNEPVYFNNGIPVAATTIAKRIAAIEAALDAAGLVIDGDNISFGNSTPSWGKVTG